MQSQKNHPHETPESEFSNFECFQNYTAPEVFVQGLAGIVNQGDVELMIRAQKHMLQRFEKTNEMLLNCNALSASRLKVAIEDYKRHVKMLNDMKRDLDYIFKKIRAIKGKINQQYPSFMDEMESKRTSYAEEVVDDDDVGVTKPIKIIVAKLSNEQVSTVGYTEMKQSPDGGAPEEQATDETSDEATGSDTG